MQLNGKQKVFVSMLDGLRTSKAEDSVRFQNFETNFAKEFESKKLHPSVQLNS